MLKRVFLAIAVITCISGCAVYGEPVVYAPGVVVMRPMYPHYYGYGMHYGYRGYGNGMRGHGGRR